MSAFTLHLQSATQYERIDNVVSVVGVDDSGSFGILPGHARMMALLRFGLARFRAADQEWEFLAVPGALLYLVGADLYVNTRRYVRGESYEGITAALQNELHVEEEALRVMTRSVRRLEEEMFKRLWKMKRTGETS